MILIIGGAYQGKRKFAQDVLGIKEDNIFFDFHIEMKRFIDENKNPNELLDKVLKGEYAAVISDEIGCGIVPMDNELTNWREATGRALCKIAEKSEQVWRVQCGIGTRIKG